MSRFDGYTGHLFEEKVLGKCLAVHDGRYKTFREAAELVRKNQPPIKAPIAARLWKEVCGQMGATVKFYTAVRTTMDELHKVDAIFELGDIAVTIDLTRNSHKDTFKADLLIEEHELDDLSMLAGRISRELKSKMRRL